MFRFHYKRELGHEYPRE